MTAGFQVTLRSMSVEVASKMDVAGIFNAEGSGQGLAVLFDALLQDDFYEYVPVPGAPFIKRKGTGLRIALRANRADVKSRLSFAALAAHTEIDHVDIRYQVRGIGLSTDVVDRLLEIDVTGAFNTGVYQQIHAVISDALPKYLSETTPLSVGEFSVPVPSFQDDPTDRARSVNYAISMLAQGRSLKDATASRPTWVSAELMLVIYARVMGAVSSDSETKPSGTQQARANTWLTKGRIG